MTSVNIHDAKTQFSRLVARAEAGETIVIARAGKGVARLVPIGGDESRPIPRIGFLEGRAEIPDDFDRWASDEIVDAFEGRV